MATFRCPNCDQLASLSRIGGHSLVEDGVGEVEYIFGSCVRCGTPALVEEYPHADGTGTIQHFPSAPKTLDVELPRRVKLSYREALQCATARAYIATAVMVRRTLEAVGKEFKPDARGLADGLKAMQAQGVISAEVFAWGEELRFLGNIGAHPTDDEITAQDATDSIPSSPPSAHSHPHLDRLSPTESSEPSNEPTRDPITRERPGPKCACGCGARGRGARGRGVTGRRTPFRRESELA